MDFDRLLKQLSDNKVQLIAVSKTKPVQAIQELYEKGQRDFGENRVQELLEKKELLPTDINWHLIGHLQKNKVKYIADFVHLIHSVDNLALAKKINAEAEKHNRKISILLQMKIATEATKFGYELDQLEKEIELLKSLENISICGMMGMGSFTTNKEITKQEFNNLKTIFNTYKNSHFTDNEEFQELSLGMSGDYLLAIEYGSTMVRIGSLIFGSRTYDSNQ